MHPLPTLKGRKPGCQATLDGAYPQDRDQGDMSPTNWVSIGGTLCCPQIRFLLRGAKDGVQEQKAGWGGRGHPITFFQDLLMLLSNDGWLHLHPLRMVVTQIDTC